ncbi:MAG TPA: sigma-70 family RNA polymerase sigma factor [Thermoanaerobaculia bacterium]|nr:sigma-70 family RNA polymerase sigma factor [Thermoanaerobaculia bacterium]
MPPRPIPVTGNVAAFRMTDQGPSDQQLIERTLDGDGYAYGVLVDRYQRKIFRVALAVVRDDGDADLVTQDTFVQAYTNLAAFEGRASLETWLTRIAVNRARDVLRRRRIVSILTLGAAGSDEREAVLEPVDERPDPERELLSSQLRAAITRAERQLSAQQKVIFRLRHYEDLPLEEIASHLGLQSGTVRAHLFRAIRKIRKELAGWRSESRKEHEPALQ